MKLNLHSRELSFFYSEAEGSILVDFRVGILTLLFDVLTDFTFVVLLTVNRTVLVLVKLSSTLLVAFLEGLPSTRLLIPFL